MKRSVIIILILHLFFNCAISQEFGLRLYVTDNENRKDTLEFGLNSSSTLEVDASFNEQDIYGLTLDSLDIRTIQRDSLNILA